MSQVVDIRNADDPRDVIHHSLQQLANGTAVALPTETGYVLAAQAPDTAAVQRITQLTADSAPCSRQLALKTAAEVRDYAATLSQLGSKLTRRCWPGPVAIRLKVEQDSGLLGALSDETRSILIEDGRCTFRVPADEIIQEVLRLSPSPLVLATEHGAATENAMARQASDIVAAYGDDVALIVDSGPSRYEQPATIVEIENGRWRSVRPGVVNETLIGRLASEVYLFVCTGNTCRSPMAEGWFRKLLAERLGCSEDDLLDHGYLVTSAGLAAAYGSPASPDSVTVAAEHAIDLRGHESRPVTDQMLDQADHIYAMTRGHRDSILSIRPDLAETVKLLSPDGSDVPDPFGFEIEEYRHCEQTIEQYLRAIIDQLPPVSEPDSNTSD